MNTHLLRHCLILLLTGILCQACGEEGGDTPGGGEGGSTPDKQIELPGHLEPKEVSRSNPMHVFAHYMPWFETPETNAGSWGQHWTMATCDPNRTDNQGRRQIASHYYPLIGPYASSDATVLNYHALLMKYSGLEGVMIDWYGTRDRYDYPANLRNTEAMIAAIERVGLKYAIVYEDATLDGLTDKVAQAQLDMSYLERNCFGSDSYVKIGTQPLLMIFGPQQLQKPKEWTQVFATLADKPLFVVLNGFGHCATDADNPNSVGEFLWVNPNPDYTKATLHDIYIGGAMPGFDDYYKEGGWGDGYTTYPHEDGALFDRQLEAARDAGLEYLQVSTWNDFGEGTTIEPTEQYAYRYLTKLQQFCGVTYNESHLKLVHRWYELKQKHASSTDDTKALLSGAFQYLISLQPEKAEELMKDL